MSDLVVREVAFGSGEYQACLRLRAAILRQPLGLNLTAEDTAEDAEQWHLIAELSGKVRGCLIVHPFGAEAVKMRQVAVEPTLQRGGIGKALVLAAEKFAQGLGAREMVLHARLSAVPFYERLRYDRVGQPFLEVTVPHFLMRKVLP